MSVRQPVVRTSSSKRRRFLVLLVLGVLTVTTAGCGSPEPKGASNATTSTTAIGVIPAQHSLAAAKVAWVKGAKVASYAQSIYLRSAALDLAVAVSLVFAIWRICGDVRKIREHLDRVEGGDERERARRLAEANAIALKRRADATKPRPDPDGPGSLGLR